MYVYIYVCVCHGRVEGSSYEAMISPHKIHNIGCQISTRTFSSFPACESSDGIGSHSKVDHPDHPWLSFRHCQTGTQILPTRPVTNAP